MKNAVLVIILVVLISGCTSQTRMTEKDVEELINKSIQEMRNNTKHGWNHMPLTYFLNESCGSMIMGRMHEAFEILQNETNNSVSFAEVNNTVDTADLDINCYPNFPVESGIDYDHITQGVTQYRQSGNLIIYANISFYNIEPSGTRYHAGCLIYPNVEIHEILHAFGFGHNDTAPGIMNSLSSDCAVREIDQHIIDKLIETYELE